MLDTAAAHPTGTCTVPGIYKMTTGYKNKERNQKFWFVLIGIFYKNSDTFNHVWQRLLTVVLSDKTGLTLYVFTIILAL